MSPALIVTLFILIFVALAGFFIFMADIVFVGHDFATTKKAKNKVVEILTLLSLEKAVLYDFGSARGGLAVAISRKLPGLDILGIDSSMLRTWEAKIWSTLNFSQAKFVCQNFKGYDVSRADVIYIYLNQKDTDSLQNKLKKELKIGARVITNTQFFAGWEAKQTYITHPNKPAYEKLFIYQKD
jgi:precorrin-6B methylase 2